jgi:hypothetical protein
VESGASRALHEYDPERYGATLTASPELPSCSCLCSPCYNSSYDLKHQPNQLAERFPVDHTLVQAHT